MSTRPGSEIMKRDPHLSTWYHHAPYGVYQCWTPRSRCRPIRCQARRGARQRRAARDPDAAPLMSSHPSRASSPRCWRRAATRTSPRRSTGTASGTVRSTTSTTSPRIRRSPRSRCSGRPRSMTATSVWSTIPCATTARSRELRDQGPEVGEHTREILAEHGFSPAAYRRPGGAQGRVRGGRNRRRDPDRRRIAAKNARSEPTFRSSPPPIVPLFSIERLAGKAPFPAT